MRWLGRLGSNQGITGSKPVALPLGYAPTRRAENISEHEVQMQSRNVTGVQAVIYHVGMVDPNIPLILKETSKEARKFTKQLADDMEMPTGAWLLAHIDAAAI